MIRTYIDAGVLIAAARGIGIGAEKSLEILKDTNREFASSIFIKLEVLPKAIYSQHSAEVEFYQTYFRLVSFWATDIDRIVELAYKESVESALGAMDALHIAAAVSVNAAEFVTYERPEKSIYRTKSIEVVSLRPN